MKKLSLLLVTLLASLIFVHISFCADGDQLSTTDFRVDGNGYIYQKVLTEVVTTSDTVTATESGKIFFMNSSSGRVTMTLPTAATGLKYTFSSINGHADSTKGGVFYLEPQDTDTFVGCVNSTSTTTFAAGDSLYSPGATGDSVTIVGASTKWYCTDRVGTFVDGN